MPTRLRFLHNWLLSPPYGAPRQYTTGSPAGTGSNRRL